MELMDIYGAFFGMQSLLAPEYIVPAMIFAFGLWLWRRPGIGFWAWLTPRSIWGHRSHRLDLILFGIGRLLVLSGLLARLTVTPFIATWVADAIGSGAVEMSPWTLAALMFVVGDLTLYWMHRVLHGWSAIWPLHALHHSAEVMTPVTAYRHHPLMQLIVPLGYSAVIGIVSGLAIGVLDAGPTVAEIAGVNTFLVISHAALANFRHSHVWIGYGPVLERLFISPAQHQIHHSTLPRHHGRNFGEVLSVWDWMFGTLYLTRGIEVVQFGLEDEPKLTTHTLRAALWEPLRRLGRG